MRPDNDSCSVEITARTTGSDFSLKVPVTINDDTFLTYVQSYVEAKPR